MSVAWYWPDWPGGVCSDPAPESCSDACCPVHGTDDLPPESDEEWDG